MQLLKNEKIINVVEETLNYMDPRLVDHGKRVAYLMFKVLKPQYSFDKKQLRDICILAMLHDIGAYKTEEIDKMVIFETFNIWEHSIYGYLFLKYFSPLNELAPAILFHHANCNEITDIDPTHQLLAQLISLCDRADIYMLQKGKSQDFRNYIQKKRNTKYRSDIIDMFLAADIDLDCVNDTVDTDPEFNRLFRDTPLTEDEVNGYIKMIIFSIDFRSSQTVIHTVATACIAGILAGMLGTDEKEIMKIKTGAMLHDIGKIGIPVHILESPDRLSASDMEIMRTHVVISEKILDGNVDNEIKNIAVRHHEKLDGSGYPWKIKSPDITVYERIVAIADIFSALCGVRNYKHAYPKEKIIGILNDMSGSIDPEIVALSVTHFDTIFETVLREAQPVLQDYDAISEEFQQLCKQYC